jgi:hypothetical protein
MTALEQDYKKMGVMILASNLRLAGFWVGSARSKKT